MDCEKAQTAMMQYMDKRIKPARAALLARHLMRCESCREYFLAFDAAMEADLSAGTEAPAGFTEAVMVKVRMMPVYEKNAVTAADIAIRIIGGICAVLLGVMLGVMANREAVADFLAQNPGLSAFTAGLRNVTDAIGGFFDRFLSSAAQLGTGATALPGGTVALLLFVVILAATLFVVYRGEKSKV